MALGGNSWFQTVSVSRSNIISFDYDKPQKVVDFNLRHSPEDRQSQPDQNLSQMTKRKRSLEMRPEPGEDKMQNKYNGSVSHAHLVRSLDDFIQDVNIKRQWEAEVLGKFREIAHFEMEKAVNELEGGARELCTHYFEVIQSRMESFYSVLDDIKMLEEELTAFRSNLGQLHEKINNNNVHVTTE